MSFEVAKKEYMETKEYKDISQKLEKEFYWLIDKYEATIAVQYGKKEKKFILRFEVTNEQNELLQHNMKEFLIMPLKNYYGVAGAMQPVSVQINAKQ